MTGNSSAYMIGKRIMSSGDTGRSDSVKMVSCTAAPPSTLWPWLAGAVRGGAVAWRVLERTADDGFAGGALPVSFVATVKGACLTSKLLSAGRIGGSGGGRVLCRPTNEPSGKSRERRRFPPSSPASSFASASPSAAALGKPFKSLITLSTSSGETASSPFTSSDGGANTAASSHARSLAC